MAVVGGPVAAAVDGASRAQCGLHVIEELDLTAQIEPNLERLAAHRAALRVAAAAARGCARAIVPEALLMNAVAAYLMPLVVQAGAHTYRLLVLERR